MMENENEVTETGDIGNNSDYQGLPRDSDMETKLYSRRFAVLLVFCLGVFFNAFSFVQYSVVTDVMSAYYDVSNLAINLTGIVYTVGFVLAMVPAIVLYETKGFKTGIVIGLAGNVIGSCIKLAGVGPDYFYLAMIGQSIMALSQTFFLTITPFVASTWFGPDEVSTAGAAGILSNCLGVSISGVLAPNILYGNDTKVIHQNFSYMLYLQSGLSALVLVVALFVVSDKPEVPPSKAQALVRKASGSGDNLKVVLANIGTMAKNKNMILLATSFSINYAVLCTLNTLLNQMLFNVYGPSASKDVGYIILCLQLANVVGAISAGILLDKTKKYRQIAYCMFFVSFLCVGAFTGLLYLSLVAVYVMSGIIGFFVGGFITVGLDLCTELSYPVSELSALGLAGIIGNTITLIFMLSCGVVIDMYGELTTNLILVGGYLVGFVLLAFVKIELKRLAANSGETDPISNS